jgi:hypothetical protein
MEEESTTSRRTPVRWLIAVVGASLALGIGGATLSATAATGDSSSSVSRNSSGTQTNHVRGSTDNNNRKGDCPHDRGDSSADSSSTETNV